MTPLTLLFAINGVFMHLFFRAAFYAQLSSAAAVVYPQDGPPPAAVETMPATHTKPTVPYTSALVVLYSRAPSSGRYDFFIDENEFAQKRTEKDATCYGTGHWVSSFTMHTNKVKFGCVLFTGPQCDSSDKILPLVKTCGYLKTLGWDKITRSFKCWDVANFHYEVHQNHTFGC
ncbi:hypothetical protein DM02DRAFT_654014 [Periconia macrospinosa]|uniref:Uncharacterized protein n=1 Tax=Periconia macrospinosa TaxID=97972 RepID=A0A2V1DVA8_9PLEO|nr:hypothetical protein DM02DRAFT_654014 [Periconia macrospinosa]